MKKLIVLLMLVPFFSLGQRSHLEEGDEYFEQRLYKEAISSYKKALEQKVVINKDHMLERVAETYKNLFEYANAEEWYAKYMAEADREDIDKRHYLYYGEVLMNNEKYDAAIAQFNNYIKKGGDKSKAEALVDACTWAKQNQDYTFNFDIVKTNLETGSRSIGLALYNNGVIYSQPQIQDFVNNTAFYDLAYAPAQNDSTFGDPRSLEGDINHKFYEGSPSIWNDTIMFYSGNATEVVKYREKKREKKGLEISEEGVNVLKVFTVHREGDKWVDVRELSFNSNSFDCTFPHISADGQALYFASNMPGGEGGFDLYVVDRVDDTSWSEPRNLGPMVNTPLDEMYPFIHADSLYFASRGHKGYGGTDLYSIPVDGMAEAWPRNLGQPINSSKDDFAMVISDDDEDGRTGYFSSNRIGPNGYDHIFHFTEILPEPEVVEVPKDTVIEVVVEVKDTVAEIKEEIVEEVKEEVVLTYDKVYFDLDKSTLRSESVPTLNDMVAYLKHHSDVKAEVSAHTDSRATVQYNLALSQRRANAVLQYLVEHGIDRSRLVPKGYGESKLVNECSDGVDCTEEQHEMNRRVELKIYE